MEQIRPLLLVDFHSAVLSGGNRRTYEILRLAKSEGIDYIVMTDMRSCRNAAKMFPAYLDTLSNYKVYMKNHGEKLSQISGLKQAFAYKNIFDSALAISRVAKEEDADLIVGSEELESLWASCIAGRYCKKPWTAVFQPTSDILQPSSSIGPLNATNTLKFVNQKASTKGLSFISRIGIAMELSIQLKTAEKSLMLSVSASVVEDFNFLDTRIKFHVIIPGNGIHPDKFAEETCTGQEYDAIFFARLIPEKGLFDLPPIWKQITKSIPKATLAVAGVTEDQKYVNVFLDMIKKFDLSQNIIFLGELEENTLIRSIKSSRSTLYPSVLDSFSLVTLESLACGTPVVAYDIAAIRQNFGKCDAVLRCPVKDNKSMAERVLSIIENEKLRKVLSEKAKEYSAKYDWRSVVRAEKEGYLKVIEYSRK